MAGESAAERHRRGVTAYEKRLRGLFDELVDATAHLKGAERMGAIDEIVRSLFLANVDVFTAADADMFEEMTGLQAAMPATEDMAKKADALVNIVRSRVWKQVYEGDESFRDAAFGPIQRNLRDGGRSLAIRSAEEHGILWARVPKGKTCAWCQMVASQGFVYSSAEAAGKAAKFHENCDCVIVPDTAEGHKAVKRLRFDIEQARADYEAAARVMRCEPKRVLGKDGKPVDADYYMRRLFPDRYDAGVRPKTVARPRAGFPGGDGTLKKVHWNNQRLDAIRRLGSMPQAEFDALKQRYPKILLPPETPDFPKTKWPKDLPRLDDKTKAHILYGDYRDGEYQGGHLAGYGWWANGTEFSRTEDPTAVFSLLRSALQDNWLPSPQAGRIRARLADGKTLQVYVSKKKGTFCVRACHLLEDGTVK